MKKQPESEEWQISLERTIIRTEALRLELDKKSELLRRIAQSHASAEEISGYIRSCERKALMALARNAKASGIPLDIYLRQIIMKINMEGQNEEAA